MKLSGSLSSSGRAQIGGNLSTLAEAVMDRCLSTRAYGRLGSGLSVVTHLFAGTVGQYRAIGGGKRGSPGRCPGPRRAENFVMFALGSLGPFFVCARSRCALSFNDARSGCARLLAFRLLRYFRNAPFVYLGDVRRVPWTFASLHVSKCHEFSLRFMSVSATGFRFVSCQQVPWTFASFHVSKCRGLSLRFMSASAMDFRFASCQQLPWIFASLRFSWRR